MESVLAGQDGAVMMYGATGSGKTSTMMGGPADAGIMPRAVSHLCGAAAEMPERLCMHVSMMEIYNEVRHGRKQVNLKSLVTSA